MLYVGIDPGEAWCGFAALDARQDGSVGVEARTYSVAAHGGYLRLAQDLINLIPHNRPTCLIVEDFRVRLKGHQAFSAANTLRFIGALEFGASTVDAFKFFLIPPNDHAMRETKELFGRILLRYHSTWPRRDHAAWKHCFSAWRVLGHHLIKHDDDLLLRLQSQRRSHRCDQWLPALVRDPSREFVAPAAEWISTR